VGRLGNETYWFVSCSDDTEVPGGENDQAVTVGQQCRETEGDASNARFHEGISAKKTTRPKQRYPSHE